MRHLHLVALALAACGGSGEADPRCRVLCTIAPPEVDGAFDVCSTDSAALCEDECSVRIAEASSTCASCLLEDACFAADSCDDSDVVFCDAQQQCTLSGRNGSCTYTFGDQAGYEDCARQVSPRREVACTAEYRPVTECSALCSDDGS